MPSVLLTLCCVMCRSKSVEEHKLAYKAAVAAQKAAEYEAKLRAKAIAKAQEVQQKEQQNKVSVQHYYVDHINVVHPNAMVKQCIQQVYKTVDSFQQIIDDNYGPWVKDNEGTGGSKIKLVNLGGIFRTDQMRYVATHSERAIELKAINDLFYRAVNNLITIIHEVAREGNNSFLHMLLIVVNRSSRSTASV
jgi:hypothetical protein